MRAKRLRLGKMKWGEAGESQFWRRARRALQANILAFIQPQMTRKPQLKSLKRQCNRVHCRCKELDCQHVVAIRCSQPL